MQRSFSPRSRPTDVATDAPGIAKTPGADLTDMRRAGKLAALSFETWGDTSASHHLPNRITDLHQGSIRMNLKTVSTMFASVVLASAMSAKADVNATVRVASASAPDAEETCLIIICCNSWRCYWKDL